MEYITVTEASNKWGISSRRICVLCKEGRIPGATKKSNVWMIPREAQKPADGRKGLVTQHKEPAILIHNATYCENRPKEQLTSEDIAICQINNKYLCGELEQAYDEIRKFVHNCKDDRYLLVAYHMKHSIESALGYKNPRKQSIARMQELLSDKDKYTIERILYHEQHWDWTQPRIPLHLINDVIYEALMPLISLVEGKQRINSLLQQGIFRDLANLEIICRELEQKDCPEISAYYHIFLGVYYNVAGKSELCRFHLKKSLDVLIPRSWYTPLAQYSATLNLKFMKDIDEEFYENVTSLGFRIVQNYIKIGVLPAIVAQSIYSCPMEVQIGFQLAQGKSNEEIAEYLGISQYKLKKHITNLFSLIGVSSRKEIVSYVLSMLVL